MAIPDWVTQQVSEDPLMSAMRQSAYGAPEQPAPLPSVAAWQPPPQTPEDAIAQAGFVPPVQVPVAEQAPTYAPPAVPVAAPVASMPEQAMSVVPEPQVSEQLASYQPPEPAQQEPQYQPQIDPYEQNTQAVLSGYLRGTRIPESVVKAAETWQQSILGPMPGKGNQEAWDTAKEAVQSAEERSLFNQQAQLLEQADISDQDARNAYMQGRGYAAESAAIADDQEQRRKVIDDRVGELDRLIEQRSQLQTSFNERNPVRDMSMWTRVAIGLGAAGQALAGGENAALSLAMREIDADMARERNQVDNLGLEIAAKRTLLGDMLQKFRDPAAADHAARAAKLGLYESGYRAQAAKEKSAELRAAMLNAADAFSVARQQEKLASLTGEHQTLMKWKPAGGLPGGIAGLNRFAKDVGLTEEQRRQLNLAAIRGDNEQVMRVINDALSSTGSVMSKDEVATARFNQEHKVQLPGGGIGYVKDKGDFEKTMTSLNKMDQNIGRLRNYVKSGSAWSPTDRANVEAISNMAMGEIRVMLGLGVMSESDKELAKSLTGDFVNDRVSVADKIKRLETLASLTNQTRRQYESRITLDPNANTPAVAPIRSVRAK